ncbi:MAG: hypothetical protein JO112_23800 [Planctomycetes bacterium]|nr:hypothetical protein [Planctomycetota bacterium]
MTWKCILVGILCCGLGLRQARAQDPVPVWPATPPADELPAPVWPTTPPAEEHPASPWPTPSIILVQATEPPATPSPSPEEVAAPPITEPTPAPTTDQTYAQAPPAGTAGAESFNPEMIGDFQGGFTFINVLQPVTIQAHDVRLPTATFFAPADLTVRVRVPNPNEGGFKIADNESPRPEDRLFLNYNYYNNIGHFGGGFAGGPIPITAGINSVTNIQLPFFQGTLTPPQLTDFLIFRTLAAQSLPLYNEYVHQVILSQDLLKLRNPSPALQAALNRIRTTFGITATSVPVPASDFQLLGASGLVLSGAVVQPGSPTDLHREMIGFEKTFLDGNASIGLRAPAFEQEGDGSFRRADFGDLSVVFKYAFLNDEDTGNVLSGGMVVTAPTGADITYLSNSHIHPTRLQPYLGGILNLNRFYLQGFTAVEVPTDARDATYLFNDLGAGYSLYRSSDRWISAIVPQVEVHVNTPLNHRGLDSAPIGAIDVVDLTAGTTIFAGEHSALTIGAVTPVTGPKPFDIEALAQFNLRF